MKYPDHCCRCVRDLLFVTLLGLILVLPACGKQEESQPQVRKQPTTSHEMEPAKTDSLVRVSVISRYNPRAMVEHYQPMIDFLADNTPFAFKLVLSRNYSSTVDKLCSGEVAVASLGGMTYLEASNRCQVKPLVKPLARDGKPFYHSVFVVRSDSPLQSIREMKGHSLALASPHSTSGALVPIHVLLRADIRLSDLSEYRFTLHHDRVAKSVLSGEYEVGALKDVVASDYASFGLRIIYRSDPIPGVPLVAGPSCSADIAESVRSTLLNMNPANPVIRKILAQWDPEFRNGFALASAGDYEALARMEQELRDAGYRPGEWR